MKIQKIISLLIAVTIIGSMSACSSSPASTTVETTATQESTNATSTETATVSSTETTSGSLAINNAAWNYDETNNVYVQDTKRGEIVRDFDALVYRL